MPTILIINDDGINSIGLSVLSKKLKELGNVVVVAPNRENSGIGKAISIGRINVSKTNIIDGIKAYATTGTPADSFLLAMNKILRKAPDLLVSGINIGPNLGIDDVLTSGTIGAAFEAAIHKVPAIAISYCLSEITDKSPEKNKVSIQDLELAATFGYKVAKCVLTKGMPKDVDIISINLPENPDCRNVELTNLCYDGYGDIHTKTTKGYKIRSWALRHYPDGIPGTDLHAIKNGNCISITPIKLGFIHNITAMQELIDDLLDI